MQQPQFGAHEMMEIHEVLTTAINGINHFQMLRPVAQDPQLVQMLDHQLQFMLNEYNQCVQLIHGQGMGQAVPYQGPKTVSPLYGLRQPPAQTPNQSPAEMDDRDVASAMLSCHKTSASRKMMAALECANPQVRRALQQGAINCAEQAYETWNFMNQKGYYQVPTLKDVTTQTMMNVYQPMGAAAAQPNAGYQ